jgi:hypothetical protein
MDIYFILINDHGHLKKCFAQKKYYSPVQKIETLNIKSKSPSISKGLA